MTGRCPCQPNLELTNVNSQKVHLAIIVGQFFEELVQSHASWKILNRRFRYGWDGYCSDRRREMHDDRHVRDID